MPTDWEPWPGKRRAMVGVVAVLIIRDSLASLGLMIFGVDNS